MLNRLLNLQFNSSIARAVLSRVYVPGKTYQIPFGPLRGMKFEYKTEINYHMVLGIYDPVTIRFMLNVLKRPRFLEHEITVADVGANVGYYSFIMSRALQSRGRIDAFEPAPDTFEKLRKNVSLNNLSNISLHQIACADNTGRMEFYVGWHHHTSSFVKTWAQGQYAEPVVVNVDAVKLDDFYYANHRSLPQIIKMDIEGGGVFALKGCSQLAQKQRPTILIESHLPAEDAAISEFIINHNYEAMRTDTKEWVKYKHKIHPHPNGIWGTLLLVPREQVKEY